MNFLFKFLEFSTICKDDVTFYYNKQSVIKMIAQVPPTLAWHIYQIIVDYFLFVVFVYVLNQFKDHHSQNDAIHFYHICEFEIERKKRYSTLKNLLEKDLSVILELICLTSNIRKNLMAFLILLFPF
jgi:Ca2+/Na+ antiporter